MLKTNNGERFCRFRLKPSCSLRYMIEFCIDETRLASLDQNLRSQNALSFSILRMHGGGPSCVYYCIGLADRQCHSPLGLQRYPPRAFNNQAAGVKHRPAGAPWGACCTCPLPPGTGLTEASAGVLCVLSAARPRPLFASSRLPVGARAAVVTRVLLCPRTDATTVPTLTLRDAGIVRRATAAAYTRQLAGFLEHLAPSSFTASQTEALYQLLIDKIIYPHTHLIPTHDRPVMAPSFTSRPHSSGSRPTSRDQEDLVIPNRTSSLHSRIAQPTGQVAQPKVNQRAPKTLTHAYMVCGVGREPSQWARAPTPPQGKIGHMKGAVGQFWLPEILGSSPRLEQDNEIARSLHAAMRVCSALRIHRYPILLTIIGMLPS
jgi:hypothetical protein